MQKCAQYLGKRRSKTQVNQYQDKKHELALIKPKYMMENMFDHIYPSTINTFKRQNHSLRSQNCQKQTNFIKERIKKMKNSLLSFENIYEANKIQAMRYRLKDVFQIPRIKRNNVQHYENDQYPNSDEKETLKLFYPLIRKRKRKSAISSNEASVDEPAHEESIIRNKYYNPRPLYCFVPSSLQKQDIPIKKATIKRQIIIKKRLKSVNYERNMRKLKKCFNAVIFITYLRRYSRLYRRNRKSYLLTLDTDGIRDKLVELKKYFMDGCKYFFEVIIQKYNVSYQIVDTDTVQMRQTKIKYINVLLNLLLKCLRSSIDEMQSRNYQTDMIYNICKHGSYGNMWKIHTSQQLALCSLSEQEGYIRADSYLEKSAIISLIFIKIIIFNILLQPHTVNLQINPLLDRSKLISNLRLIGNILYELMITDQDQLLDKCDQNYIISNWTGLLHKFNIEPANSLTMKEGLIYKFQIISGLMDHKLITKKYKIDHMIKEKKLIQEMVSLIYQNIRKYHEKYRKSFF